jgi:hypothetical protein
MQERVRAHVNYHVVAAPRDVKARHGTHRRARLALGAAECTEIVLADEQARGALHAFGLER